jgi:hypothetical protein
MIRRAAMMSRLADKPLDRICRPTYHQGVLDRMFDVADGRHRFAVKQHALGHRGSDKFDATVQRVQVEIGGSIARLAVLRHQIPQRVAKLRHIIGVIMLSICNAVARSPDKATIVAVRIGVDGRSAERLPEQPRGESVTAFVNADPQVVIRRAPDRRKQFAVPALAAAWRLFKVSTRARSEPSSASSFSMGDFRRKNVASLHTDELMRSVNREGDWPADGPADQLWRCPNDCRIAGRACPHK